MANYDIVQLTEGEYVTEPLLERSVNDLYFPLNVRPTISDDGSRVVFASRIEPERGIYSIWLYDRDSSDEPRRLSVNIGGDDRLLVSRRPQISGDGQKIVFDGYVFDEDAEGEGQRTGIHIYNIETGTIRRVVNDRYPHWPSGLPRHVGGPGLTRCINSRPSISSDGQRIAYLATDYEYAGSTRDHWRPARQRLMLAEISDDGRARYGYRVRGDSILGIERENVHGHGIRSLRMSGDGRFIAFYAGGVVEGLDVSNLQMPQYETETHSEYAGPTCDVYCYVVRIQRPGRYTLEVVPEPDSQTRPLVVAHIESTAGQSFSMNTIFGNPPSICTDGSRIALHAGFVRRAENTVIYIYDGPFGTSSSTKEIITFGSRPGVGPGEPLTTGAVPAISSDGRWLAYYRRDVLFPEGYGDPGEYEEDETHCPFVQKDEVQVRRIPRGDVSNLIFAGGYPGTAYTPAMGLGISQDASHATFISRADIVRRNMDRSHEVYYATRL